MNNLVELAKEKHYFGFHCKGPEIKDAWYMELCSLQKWLREKHNIRIVVTAWTSGYWGYNAWVINEIPERGWIRKNDTLFGNDHAYEEALEKGLIYALNLIKI